jgi:hypothetical protein
MGMMMPKAWGIIIKKNILHVACHSASQSQRGKQKCQRISRTRSS